MSKTSIRLDEYKRDKDGIADITKYTVYSHSSEEYKTIVDWDVKLEYECLTGKNIVSMDIHSDGFETKEEAMEQLGRWLKRLGESLEQHNFK